MKKIIANGFSTRVCISIALKKTGYWVKYKIVKKTAEDILSSLHSLFFYKKRL